MSATPTISPTHSEPDLNAPKRAFLKPIYDLWESVAKWRQFKNTRTKIVSGAPLFDWPEEERAKAGVMGPFLFNFYQSVFSALPAIVIAKTLEFLYPLQTPGNLTEFGKKLVGVEGRLFTVTQAFVAPSLLMIIALLAAKGAIKPKDSTPVLKQRCRNACLYYNGAFGLIPQGMIALALVLIIGLAQRGIESIGIYSSLGVLVLAGMIWQLRISQSVIPKKLFALCGYPIKRPRWKYVFRSDPEAGPWNRYQCHTYLLGGIAGWALILLQVIVVLAISMVITKLLCIIQGC